AKLQIDPWAAPSLVGQALYGAALARAFGSKFLVLRLSTLALGCGLAWILWTLLARVGADPGFVRVSILTWLFNPIGFALSFSFRSRSTCCRGGPASGSSLRRGCGARRSRSSPRSQPPASRGFTSATRRGTTSPRRRFTPGCPSP